MLRFLILLMLTLCACSLNAAPTEPFNDAAVADASAADGDSGLDQMPEDVQRIYTGVGVVRSALSACTAAKTKMKARYARTCPHGFSEDDEALRSWECSTGGQDYDFYFIWNFNTPSGPPPGYAWFRVFRRQACPANVPVCDGGSVFEYTQCSCNDSSPCTRLSA